MINRYKNQKISYIWDDQNKFDTWKKVQETYVKTLEEEGVAKPGISEKIASVSVKAEEVYEREKVTNHDLASFVDILQNKVGEGSNWIHYGLTSSDVVDTSNSLLIKESLEVLLKLVDDLLNEIKNRAIDEQSTKIIGRTHGVFAEETFLGNILGNWYLEIKRNLDRLSTAKETISYGKLSGPVGNYTVVTPEIEDKTLKKLDLKAEKFASQIVSRDRYAEVVSAISILASSYDRIAGNLRSYQRSEISEIFEPFKEGQKGSSAMPHKKNPIGSERISGLSRIIRGYSVSSLENMVLWNERDISNSSVERIIIPDSFNIICFMTTELTSIIKNMVINREQINKNLENAKNKSISQKVLSELVNKGIDRDNAYRSIQNLIFENNSAEELIKAIEEEFDVDLSIITNSENKISNNDSFLDKFE
jgi:adenylosuccinate lyase